MRCGWGRPPTAAWRGVGPRDCRGWPTATRVVFKNGWVSVRFSTLLRVKRAGWSLVLSREGAEPTAPPLGSRSCAVKLTAPRGRVQNHPIIHRLEGEKNLGGASYIPHPPSQRTFFPSWPHRRPAMGIENRGDGSLGRRWGSTRPHRAVAATSFGDGKAGRECPPDAHRLATKSRPAQPPNPFDALIGGVVLSDQLLCVTKSLDPFWPTVVPQPWTLEPQRAGQLKRHLPTPADGDTSARLRSSSSPSTSPSRSQVWAQSFTAW